MNNLLQRLIDKRDRLTAAIEVLQEETSEPRQARARRNVRAALEAQANGNNRAPAASSSARKPKKSRVWNGPHSPFRGHNREVAAVPVPPDMSIKGLDFSEAVVLAIKAVPDPIPTPELTLLLETAGAKFPKLKMPRRRYVGMIAARLAADTKQIRKTPEGWARR